jgi:flagellar basal-body rod protein FlgB
MPISDFPILSMLRTRMQWHQERQRVLAENVANADTPNYRARDLAPPDFESVLQRTGSLTMARNDPTGQRRLAIRRGPELALRDPPARHRRHPRRRDAQARRQSDGL